MNRIGLAQGAQTGQSLPDLEVGGVVDGLGAQCYPFSEILVDPLVLVVDVTVEGHTPYSLKNRVLVGLMEIAGQVTCPAAADSAAQTAHYRPSCTTAQPGRHFTLQDTRPRLGAVRRSPQAETSDP